MYRQGPRPKAKVFGQRIEVGVHTGKGEAVRGQRRHIASTLFVKILELPKFVAEDGVVLSFLMYYFPCKMLVGVDAGKGPTAEEGGG